MSSSYLNVPIFAGQGTDAADSPRIIEQSLRDLTSPSCALLLFSCFNEELSKLSPVERQESGLEPTDFKSPKDLISSFPEHYVHNPIISGIKLFLFQSLRYLAHIERSSTSSHGFTDALKANAIHNLGVLGFSSGILPACVVATSQSALAYISNSVEGFRLAFWIGMRTMGYRRGILRDGGHHLPWSIVLGMDRKEAEAAIDAFPLEV